MKHEIETKVLEVDEVAVRTRLKKLGAALRQDILFKVDWYRDPAWPDEQDEWFLRIRSSSAGVPEVTWKAQASQMTVARKVREISFHTEQAAEIGRLFEAIGLVRYAHQEKYRASWEFEDWRFDLDRYPDIPTFLEIEGRSNQHVGEAIALLGLNGHQTYTDGERTLIQNVYHHDWYQMRFENE